MLGPLQDGWSQVYLKYHSANMQTVHKIASVSSPFSAVPVDIVKFAVTFGLTSRIVTIKARAYLPNQTRVTKREKPTRAMQCKKYGTWYTQVACCESAKTQSLITHGQKQFKVNG